MIRNTGIGPYQPLEATMWIRTLMLMFAVGCAAVGDTTTSDTTDELGGPVLDGTKKNFGCNAVVNVASCIGSVNVGPIIVPVTVIVTKNTIFSKNDVDILVAALNNTAILDKNKTDITVILVDLANAAVAAVGGTATACDNVGNCHTS